jgi:ribonuclease BN (tRNA processing enzyme)
VSPRYTHEEEAQLDAEARAVFPLAEVAKSLEAYPIPLPD